MRVGNKRIYSLKLSQLMLVLMFLDLTECIKEEAMKFNIYPFISPHVFDVILI